MTITAALLVTMRYTYDTIGNYSFDSICYSLHSCYSVLCLLIMDGLFAHCVNDIYLRFRELNEIAIRHSREKTTLLSLIDRETSITGNFNARNDATLRKIRSIQHIHHELYVLATKVLSAEASNSFLSFYSVFFHIIKYKYTVLLRFEQVNGNFSVQLLLASAICLNDTILLLHDVYYDNVKRTDNTSVVTLIFHASFIILHVLRSLYISCVCQRSKNQV